jgi:hypothetical protein
MEPSYDWLEWKFFDMSAGFWKSIKNQRRFLNWAEKELKITEPSGWLQISTDTLSKLGGTCLSLLFFHCNLFLFFSHG